MLRLSGVERSSNHERGFKSIFRPTEIGSKKREVREMEGKIVVFKLLGGSKNIKGSRNQDSTVYSI